MLQGHRRLPIAACVCVVLALPAAAAHAASGPTLALTLDPNVPVVVDLAPPGKSPGDRYAINAVVRDRSGAQVGMFRASQTSIGVTSTAETVQTEGVFALADGTIVFAGVATSPLRTTGLTVGASFERAVIGGTGRYAGAGGTLTSRKAADGHYDQTLRLVLPHGTPTTMTIPADADPSTQPFDLGPNGLGPGDLIGFVGTIVDPFTGAPTGVVRATQSVLAPTGDDFAILSSVTFGLRDGDLAVAGLGEIPQVGTTLVGGQSFERALVGGTRGFVGRGGTETVVRVGDGRYANHVRMWPPVGRALRLHTGATNVGATTVDLGAPGASPGNVEVFRDQVTSAAGRPIGSLVGTRTNVTTAAGPVAVETLLTFDLRDGTIVVSGLSPTTPGPVVRAVLGGTGRYAGMRGSVRAAPGPNGTFSNDFRLQRVG